MGSLGSIIFSAASALLIAAGYSVVLGPDVAHFKEPFLIAWAVILLMVVSPFRLWKAATEKVEALEELAKPKLAVSDPIAVIEPKGTIGKAVRIYRLRIDNRSTSVVRNCYAKKTSMINKKGQESDSVGMHFKMSTDQPFDLINYPHQQNFDIPPMGHEIIEIAVLDERQPNNNVTILYATKGHGSGALRNSIPQSLFPHNLTVQFCGDNTTPVEKKYRLYIDEGGIFRMDIFCGG